MFGWFKAKRERTPKPLYPESLWIISMDDENICVRDTKGQEKTVAKATLSGVAIETNDSGPWGADLWWLLYGADDTAACWFPQGATGEDAALAFLTSLPNFDHGQMVIAMRSTQNATFPVWRRMA